MARAPWRRREDRRRTELRKVAPATPAPSAGSEPRSSFDAAVPLVDRAASSDPTLLRGPMRTASRTIVKALTPSSLHSAPRDLDVIGVRPPARHPTTVAQPIAPIGGHHV